MKQITFIFVCLVSLIFVNEISATEVYCQIKETDKNTEIIPNYDYLTKDYWVHILYDENGNKREFENGGDALEVLSAYGWTISRTEMTDSCLIYIMSHTVTNNNELKHSRERLYNVLNEQRRLHQR